MDIDRDGLARRMVADRRAFHMHAESAFAEFWTAARIAGELRAAGWEVLSGAAAMRPESRMGLPAAELLDARYRRALSEGADPKELEPLRGGLTAVVGVMRNGPGPTIAYRFDIDAVDVSEAEDPRHLPTNEGFASIHPEAMHACGHDAHIAIGLAVARALAGDRAAWKGTVKLVFQPAEEGVRGAKSVVDGGILDDVDYAIAGHIGIVPDGSGSFYRGVAGFLSTTKLDIHYKGRSAHAGSNPELGRSAILAAASAVVHLQGISRHSGGATRINVGRIEGGSGRNVIPERAFLALETRGQTSALNEYVAAEATRIAQASGAMFGVETRIEKAGEAMSSESDLALMELAGECAREAGYRKVVDEPLSLGGSEDFSLMMNRVKEKGGKAVYVVFGTTLADAHHSPLFDIDERDLPAAAVTLAYMAERLSAPRDSA